MVEMPKIIKNCELPVGTRVKVHKYHEVRPFQAIVRGYDMHHSKFEVGRQSGRDEYDNGGWWAFPQEIAGYCLPDSGQWWYPDPMPSPPEPMSVSEYEHLADQPVVARWTEMPDHIYGEPEERIVRGILEEPRSGYPQVRRFYGRAWDQFPWELVIAATYDELTTQNLRDWFADDPKAAMRFAFDAMWRERKIEELNKDSMERLQALADKAEADRERREAAREAAIEDMRH